MTPGLTMNLPLRPDRNGFTLIETMVAAVVAVIIFFGLTQIYTRGRTQLDFEENHRKATALVQGQMEAIRRDNRFDGLDSSNNDDHEDDDHHGHGGGDDKSTITIDGVDFSISESVTVGVPETHAATVEITVNWTDYFHGTDIPRTLTCTTILGRGMK